jgi:hypothetical protein
MAKCAESDGSVHKNCPKGAPIEYVGAKFRFADVILRGSRDLWTDDEKANWWGYPVAASVTR